MITAVIKGGLGNQLFQFASSYALAKRLNQELVLDNSFFPKQTLRGYKLGFLKLDKNIEIGKYEESLLITIYKNKYINGLIRRSHFKTLPIKHGTYLIDHAGEFTPSFFDVRSDNIFMNGYFQSEEYFKDVRGEILRQINPSYTLEKEYCEILEKIKETNSVAIHIRHGDFLKADGTDFHYILDKNYYIESIKRMREMTGNPTFYCFSDDIEWVKANIGDSDDFQFVSLSTEHPDIDEMMLMKNCQNIITANSTFSWWAAWLNENENALIFCPNKAYGNPRMIPSRWTKVCAE